MTETVLTGARGEKLVFDGDSVILKKLETAAAKSTYTVGEASGRFGAVVTGGSLGAREIRIEGVFLSAGTTEEERLSSLREWRHLLCRITAPGETFTLSRDGFSAELVASGAVAFSSDPAYTGSEASAFTLTAMAPDPRFFAPEERFFSRSVSGRNLVFPMSFPSGGFHFGRVTAEDSLPVCNRGDVTVGGVITVEAKATLPEFSMTLEETGETFSLKKPLSSGESMMVDTREGRLCVEFAAAGGEWQEDFSRIRWDSDFFRFPVGNSTVTWESGESDAVHISVGLRPAYLSL